MHKVRWCLIAITLLFAFTNNVYAQSCTDTHPNVHFQAGSFSGAPHFRTPEAAGIARCPLHGTTFVRVEKQYYTHPVRWGALFCHIDSGNGEQSIGTIYFGCCEDNEVLIDGLCTVPADNPDKEDGCSAENNTKNPCNVATGNKFRTETDLTLNGLSFTRYYNSRNLAELGLGKGWRHNYQRKLTVSGSSISLISQSGRGEPWVNVGGVWQGDSDSDHQLIETANGYEVTRSNNAKENYNAFGQITSNVNSAGEQTSYEYGIGGLLTRVTNHYGQSLIFNYEGARLTSISNSAGETYRYEYDANNNLVAVVFPDDTPADTTDNLRKLYHYEDVNFPNHLTGITDENGDRFGTYAFDTTGKAASSERGVTSNTVGQERITLSYDSPTQTTVTDAIGTQEQWTFLDVLGARKLTSKINQVDGKGITQTWDANGNMLSRTDAEGRVMSYTYNATNQRTSMTEASGTSEARTTTYEYVNADIDLVTKTISPSIYANNSKEVINTYDTNQNITSVTINGFDAQGGVVSRVTTFSHDSLGKITSINGPRTDVNDITTLEYYNCNTGAECGQLKTVTNALGHESSYDEYDAVSRLTKSTDPNGVVTTYQYHPRGWLLSMTQTPPVGSIRTTLYEYDNAGQLTKTTLPDGTEQNYVYDAAHDLREIFDNLGNKVSYTYDAKGNRTDELVYDPDGALVRSTITTYNHRNFIESINNAGSVTQLINDAVGNLSTQTDPNVNPTTDNTFDALDRLTNTVDALANNSGYDYDVADQLARVTAPNGAVTQYEYDDLGNQTKEISADRGTITYTHDDAGNVISMTDARSITTQYQYDALNRLTAVVYPTPSENVTYSYDNPIACGLGIGRLCQAEDDSGIARYHYDAWGNVLVCEKTERDNSGTDIGTFTTLYEYDAANRITGIDYPSGRTASITRDVIGRLISLSTTNGANETTQLISARTYRADGMWVSQTYGNGLVQTKDYDLQGRLIDNVAGDYTRQYSYDANGNILTADAPDNTSNLGYGYDVLDRLVSQNDAITNMIQTFDYDANGNREERTKAAQSRVLSYEANSNRLATVGNDSFTLDASGKTLADPKGRTFAYNNAGRLKDVFLNGTIAGRYTYNNQQLRTQKVTSGETTVYHYDLGGNLIAESFGNRFSKEYLYADGELVTYIELDGPVITAPSDVTIEATATLTAVALGEAVAQDSSGGSLIATPDNQGPFSLGETIITWSVTDSGGNTVSDIQRINVVDTTAPTMTAPQNVQVEVSAGTQVVLVDLGEPITNDLFDVTVTNDAPNFFGVTDTQVNWTATDSSGNSVQATQMVSIDVLVPPQPVFNGLCQPLVDNTGGVSNALCDGDMATGLNMGDGTWHEMDFGSTLQGSRLTLSLQTDTFASANYAANLVTQNLKLVTSSLPYGNMSYQQIISQPGVIEHDLSTAVPNIISNFGLGGFFGFGGFGFSPTYHAGITIDVPGFMRYLRIYSVSGDGTSVELQEFNFQQLLPGDDGYLGLKINESDSLLATIYQPRMFNQTHDLSVTAQGGL